MNADKKIKILVLIPTLQCGGSENYVSLLCNNIDINSFDVTLAVLDNTHPFYSIRQSHVQLVDLGTGRVRNSLLAIKRIIKQLQPDIVYSTANHLNLLLATFRWMFSKKIKFVARESSIVSLNSRRAIYPELYGRLIKKFYARFDCIICQSVYMQHDLVAHFDIPKNKTVVLHNPVAEIAVNEAGKQATENSPGKIYKLITVARLSEEKGIDRLLRAVAELPLPFQYYIIGEGGERKVLQRLVDELQLNDKVFLTGEKINPWYNMEDADLFLTGSYYEGFPNAVAEAGSLGIPVVAFDAPGGTAEIIHDGENGLLVKSGSEKDFAAAIEKALQMNFNRESIAAATKKRYSINAITGKTENLFRQLLTGSMSNWDK